MRVFETVSSGDRFHLMARSGDCVDRLLVAVALLGIVLWGFTGSWEYPTIETSVPPVREVKTPIVNALAGAQLFEANGCYACHSLQGDRKIGPGLRGIFGETVELDDGSTVLIDEDYLVESVLQPGAKRVAGYDDAEMPSYEGLVSAEDASVLAEYIKGLE